MKADAVLSFGNFHRAQHVVRSLNRGGLIIHPCLPTGIVAIAEDEITLNARVDSQDHLVEPRQFPTHPSTGAASFGMLGLACGQENLCSVRLGRISDPP